MIENERVFHQVLQSARRIDQTRYENINKRKLSTCDEHSNKKSKVNLVMRRLITVDRILVTVGGSDIPTSKKQEPATILAVHPNYELS